VPVFLPWRVQSPQTWKPLSLHARREKRQLGYIIQTTHVCYYALDESESQGRFVCSSLTAYKRSACKGLNCELSTSRLNPNIRASLPDIAKLPLPLYPPAVAVLNPMVPHPTTSNDRYPWIYYSVNLHSAGTGHRLFLASVWKSRATRLRLIPYDLPYHRDKIQKSPTARGGIRGRYVTCRCFVESGVIPL
jgi:hypothetical protein